MIRCKYDFGREGWYHAKVWQSRSMTSLHSPSLTRIFSRLNLTMLDPLRFPLCAVQASGSIFLAKWKVSVTICSKETNSLLAWMEPPIRGRYNRHRADYNCRYARCPSYQSCGLTRLPSYQRCERSCEPRMTFMTRAKYKK